MAALLLWSGWPQRQFLSLTLLSLPLLDAVLFLLPLVRPDVLKSQAYLPLVSGVHNAYRLALLVLFALGLSRQTTQKMFGCTRHGRWTPCCRG
jgi:hypothetical protein